MDLEYMKKYTDIRTGKMSFTQFMEFANDVFGLGYEKGSIISQSELTKQFIGQTPPPRKCGEITRIAYESIF